MQNNSKNPYASRKIKYNLVKMTGLTLNQVSSRLTYQRNKQRQLSINGSQRFNRNSLMILKKFYEKSPRPNRKELEELAKLTDNSKKKVATWFTYQRFKKKLI